MRQPSAPDDTLTILHVSDVHFGVKDDRKEMPRITDELVKAAHLQPWTPDVCIFSGDLAHDGSSSNLDAGAQWLGRLVDKWPDAKLFVVPGNHDVERDKASILLRQAYIDEPTYAEVRPRFQTKLNHMESFFAAHERMRSTFGPTLVSSWDTPFSCSHAFTSNGRPIRLIGINTSTLSCANDDNGKLVVDLGSLNNLLNERQNDDECVVAVGHHPLNWLAPWNYAEVERVLKQAIGAHIYLHGHQHEQISRSENTSRGESLATLECGAAYQGSQWPQYFSMYQLKFTHGLIDSSIFALAPGLGHWVKNNERSLPISARLPRNPVVTIGSSENSPKSEKHNRIRSVSSVSSPQAQARRLRLAEPSQTNDRVELDARRRIDEAQPVFDAINSILSPRFNKSLPLYTVRNRPKELESLVGKVNKRIQAGDKTYTVKSVEDICAFRYVALFQSDIPVLIRRVVDELCTNNNGACEFDYKARVTVHTSRPHQDPLSIKPLIDQLFADWPEKVEPTYISRPTGYSSVHVVLDCTTVSRDNSPIEMPIEIQFRSGLEEFWGQLDHRLRYDFSRGTVGDSAWQRHLNVLKTLFDAAIQYVDLIKEAAEQPEGRTAQVIDERKRESMLSLSNPETILKSFSDLPVEIYEQLASAYSMWTQADASRQFGGSLGIFRQAADAFVPLLDGCPQNVSNPKQRERLASFATLERAFMLSLTNDPDDLDRAESYYRELLKLYDNEATALLRLGQVLSKKQLLKEAADTLELAIEATKSAALADPSSDSARIFDFARTNKALAHFRDFEDKTLEPGARAAAIQKAIIASKSVVETGRDKKSRYRALNDVVYYSWEEIRFQKTWAGGTRTLSPDEFSDASNKFIQQSESETNLSYRVYDTLCRVAEYLALEDKTQEFAKNVLQLLEQIVRARGGNERIEGTQFSGLWSASVMSLLNDEDERDSLRFALSKIQLGTRVS
jgi:ppGpp synthetase/RelA/SpoT-type nucleotidyltranferase